MKRMKSRADPNAPPILTPRERLLLAHGPGVRPCLDGANNWLGCAHPSDDKTCWQQESDGFAPICVLASIESDMRYLYRRPVVPKLTKEERNAKHHQALTAKKAVTKRETVDLYDAIASVPARDLLPESVKKCGLCGVPMRPIGNALVCSKCGGVLTTRKAVS